MKNIALTGMMGCGKSTVSKELKKLLPEFNYIDLDMFFIDFMEVQLTCYNKFQVHNIRI